MAWCKMKSLTKIVLVLLLYSFFSIKLGAQEWVEPILLSEPAEMAWFPCMVLDDQGVIHLIYSGWTSAISRPSEQTSDTVFYMRNQDGIWSEAVDVLVAGSPGQTLNVRHVTIAENTLLVPCSVSGNLAIAKACIDNAVEPSAWSSEVIAWDVGSYSNILFDVDTGCMYLAYVENASRVVLSRACDVEAGWSEPITIWESPSPSSAPTSLYIAFADDGGFHIVWSEHTATMNWGGEAIWHAYIPLDGGLLGATTVRQVFRSDSLVGPTVDSPIVSIGNEGRRILVFWNNGVGSSTGRYYQWSFDGGDSWRPVSNLFAGELSGQTRFAAAVWDVDQVLHLVTSAFGPDRATGLRYVRWADGNWTNYESLWVDRDTGNQERPFMLLDGNILHLVWNNTDIGQIYYSYLILGLQDIADTRHSEAVTPTILADNDFETERTEEIIPKSDSRDSSTRVLSPEIDDGGALLLFKSVAGVLLFLGIVVSFEWLITNRKERRD